MSDKIEAFLTDNGFSSVAHLVRDEFDGRDGQSVWSVSIKRGETSLTVEYSMGAAHRHYRNNRPINLNVQPTFYNVNKNKATKPNNPTLVDVMCAVVLDAQCVADGQDFEDFCAELGYDEDSRRAEECYRGCLKEYQGLKRLFGRDGLDQLAELYQDY